jgi:uncharacterized protein YfaT (DUF1175 family)
LPTPPLPLVTAKTCAGVVRFDAAERLSGSISSRGNVGPIDSRSDENLSNMLID